MTFGFLEHEHRSCAHRRQLSSADRPAHHGRWAWADGTCRL